MTNTPVSAKVRFVRCPKCREVLAELPEITVYKCGGCGTVLQAKSRKVEMNRAEAALRVKDDVAGTGQGEAISSNQDFNSPATVLSPNENCVKPEDCNEFRNPNEKESITEDTQKLDDKNRHASQEESERVLQEGNDLVGIQNSPETKDKENEVSPLEKDQTTQNPLADSNSSSEIVSRDAPHTVEPSVVNDDTDDVCTSEGPSTETDRKSTNDDPTAAPATLERKTTPVVPLEKDQMTQNPLADSSSVDIVSHDASENIEPREEVNDGTDYVCASKSSCTEKEPKPTNDDPTPAQIALERKITPIDPLYFDDGHLVHHRVSVSSVDTMESSKPFDSSFELGNKHGHDIINSPTTKSYYAQDGSESSYDGTDYRSQQHVSHPFRRRVNNGDSTSARGLLQSRHRVNNTVNSDQESNYQRRPHSSSILHERHHSMDYRNHNEVYSSKLSLYSGEFASDHRTGNPTAYHREPLPSNTSFHTHKLDLLRSVCELQDQLDQMQLPKFTPNGRNPSTFVNGNSSSHYNRLEPGLEIYASSNLNPRRAQRYNGHRVAFSGEAAHHRHHVNSSFSNRYPQQRYHSAQLPSHSTHTSSFSSPHRYSSSEIKRLYLKEKYHTEKRHLRPIAGAAPFLTCYRCSQLLELPADFLLVGKRCHQVRCNACRMVLKFSLDEKAHLAPFVSQTKNKNLTATVESTGLVPKERKMRKPCSEKRERTSALHWLMGYESPSQVYDE